MTAGSLVYLLSARSRGLLTWEELPAFALGFFFVAAIPAAVGCVFLADWSRKRSALRAYEEQITWMVERANTSSSDT